MKTNLLKYTLLAAVIVGSIAPLTASASPHHHRHGYKHGYRHGYKHGHRHHSSTKVVVVNPAPVVVPRTVVVDRGYPSHSVQIDVQRALAKRGYYGGVIDGDIGPRTRAAIRAYQVDRGLPVTGVIDTPLLRSLRLI